MFLNFFEMVLNLCKSSSYKTERIEINNGTLFQVQFSIPPPLKKIK